MKKILAIDDQKDNLTTIKAVIKSNIPHCEVLTALSGEEGIQIALQEQPDTILLDIIMPNLDGYEVCKRLKADKETRHIPVILITAIKTDADSRIKGLNLGADAFLSKPIDPVELSAQVNVMLRIKEAEDKLREENQKLEDLIADRTLELVAKNKNLQHEINERKQAEQWLKESKERYRLLFDIGNDIILVHGYTNEGKQSEFLEVNEKACQVLEYTKEELYLLTPGDIVLNSEVEQFLTDTGKVKTNSKLLFEKTLVTKTGKHIPVEIHLQIFSFNGKPTALSIVRDITQRKSVQEHIEKISKHYQAIIEKAPDGIVLLDEKANFKYISPAAKRIFGYKITENIEGDPGRFAHPDDMPLLMKHLEKLMVNPSYTPTIQFRFSNAKGEWRWIESTISNLLHDSNVEAIVVNFHDITEFKTTEAKLTESEQKFRDFTNLLPQIVYETDINGNLVYMNKIGLEEFGYSQDDIEKGLNVLNGIAEQDRERAKIDIQNVVHGKLKLNEEYRALRKDGSTFPFLIYSRIIYKNNIPVGLQGVIVNISERKKEEEILRESEQKLRLMIQNSPVGVSTTDLEGRFIEVNPALCKIVGYTKEEMLGIHYNNFSHTEDKQKNQILFEQLVEGEIAFFDLEKRYLHKEGKIVHVRIRAQLIRNEKGIPLFQTAIIEDISEQKETKEMLVKQEARIRSIFRSAPVGIGVVINRVIKQVNNSLCEMTGYKVDELYNQSARIFYQTQEEFDRVGKVKYSKLLKEGTGTMETRFKRKDGKIIDVLLSSTPINPADLSVGVTFTALDITERKQAEIAIRENEQKLRNIFENSTSLYYSHSSDHVLTYLSPQVQTILGYSMEEAMTKWTSFVTDHPINEIGYMNTVRAIETGERQAPYELELVKKDGAKIWVEVREYPLVENGKTISIVGSLTEITERKRAEQIQKVLYNISQAAISSKNIEDLIVIIQKQLGTIIDTQNFYIAFYNEKTDMFTSPIISDEKDDLATWPAGKSFSAYVVKGCKSLLVKEAEMLKMRDEGTIEMVGVPSKVWLGVPLKTEGETKGVFAVQSYTNENAYTEKDQAILEFVANQISTALERKNAEQNLIIALKKANESDRLKSAFLATMSHELRTPLNAIIGFSEILEEDLPADEIKKFGEIINSSGIHLLSIVNDLFDITLIESGETVLRKDIVNLKALIYNVKSIIDAKLHRDDKTRIDFKLVIPGEIEDFKIIIDSNKLKQILINLLKNAFKFTEKGSVTLGVELETDDKNQSLLIYVADTGIGIEKEKQDIIFDIFRQVEDTAVRKYGGTGIGLSVAKRLTEILGGKIWIESEIGKGSSFYINIPFENAEDTGKKDEKSSVTIINQNAKTVLIAEDDEPSFLFIKVILEKMGLNILWAKNGEEAVLLCKSNKYISLVLMDINMPVLNGYEATKKIKSFNPSLPIIAQTAYAVAGDSEKSIEAGCDDYISKPIGQHVLIEKINRLLA